jgi:hypothetical protein
VYVEQYSYLDLTRKVWGVELVESELVGRGPDPRSGEACAVIGCRRHGFLLNVRGRSRTPGGYHALHGTTSEL